MDDFVKTKLREWNLTEQLLSTFEENFIDAEAFNMLNIEAITSLIPKIGLRLKFLRHWEQERKNNNSPIKDGNPGSADQILNDTSLPVIDIADLEVIVAQAERGNIVDEGSGSSSTVSEVRSFDKIDTRVIPEKSTEFLSMLQKSVKGIGVTKQHALGHKFEQDTRLALADAIISVEILKWDDYKIPSSRMIELAGLIETTFPPEKAITYYIPYELNKVTKKRVLAKGKLYDKYCGYRAFLRDTDVLSKKKSRIQVGKTIILGYRENLRSIEECEDINVKVDWLQNCLEPWTTVEKYWQETAKHRIGLLTSSEAITSHQYLTTFKALQQPLGLNLVKIDFAIVHPDKTLSFYAQWPVFQSEILKYCCNRKKNDSCVRELLDLLPQNIFNNENDQDSVQITSDCLAVFALRLLPLLLPCPYIKVGKKPAWRPTKAEIQNEFLLHVTSITELETELAARKRKHEKYGLTEQPVAIVVGESLKAIEHYFVCINTVKYRTDSVLAAIDTTFQCFFALQLEYPRAAELPWLTVQQRIYAIQDESAKNIPSVSTLINDITTT